MEVDNADNLKKEHSSTDSDDEIETLYSNPKLLNTEDVKSKKLDFKHDNSISIENKPSTSKLPTRGSFFKFPRWCYDDSIPQFGPTKFQRIGDRLTIAKHCEKEDSTSTSGDYSLKKTVLEDFSEPMLVAEPVDDIKSISASECQYDVEMPQAPSEPIPTEQNVMKNRSEIFTEINKANSQKECADDIDMEENPGELMIRNEDNVCKVNSKSFSTVNEVLLPTGWLQDIGMLQTSVKISNEDDVLKIGFEGIEQNNEFQTRNECLGGIGIQNNSPAPMSSDVFEKSIPEVNRATSPSLCSNDIVVKNQSTIQHPEEEKIEKSALRRQSGDTSESGRDILTSGCKKNLIHSEKPAKRRATKADVNDGERGVKRKHSDSKQRQERASERNGHYFLRPLILDRPRRSSGASNSRQK